MRITEILNSSKPVLSIEVFPPKSDANFESVCHATEEIAKLKPAFISVTYGAGGVTDQYTMEIARRMLAAGVTPLPHLTCLTSDKAQIAEKLQEMKDCGIENIMALRGDIPQDLQDMSKLHYHYAYELVQEIRQSGDFCIGAACYPEGHTEAPDLEQDILHLKQKVEAGCDFLTTQMFFENEILLSYLYKIREAGIHIPVIAGIMPVTNAKQIKRICELSGTYLPGRFKRIVDRFGYDPESMEKAGIAYATEQIISLFAAGINAVHIYSMNKPHVAAAIQANLKGII